VRVRAADSPAGWTFVRVEDTGVGIAPEQLDRIWEAFEQADASRTRKFGGSGLGLTISRHLARLMGGDITVRSQPGLGSSFVLWLPAADPADARTEASTTTAASDALDVLAERRDATGLAEVAEALVSEAERVLATYAARLRADPAVPHAHAQGETQLEDHASTFIVDMAQCLLLVGQDGPEAVEMLRDGSAIQRLIAGRHGAQRARLGWTGWEMRREYEILRDEIHAAVRRRATRADLAAEARALALIDHMLARAEDASLATLQDTAAES
jgi:hypothetical protein